MGKEQRKAPGPMKVFVFRRPEDGSGSLGELVHVGAPGDTGETVVKAALCDFGYGRYTVVTGRQTSAEYREEKRDVFAFGKEG